MAYHSIEVRQALDPIVFVRDFTPPGVLIQVLQFERACSDGSGLQGLSFVCDVLRRYFYLQNVVPKEVRIRLGGHDFHGVWIEGRGTCDVLDSSSIRDLATVFLQVIERLENVVSAKSLTIV